MLGSALLATALCAPARAQDSTSTVIDSGRLLVYSKGRPIGIEDFQYERRNDTLFITSRVGRKSRGADGSDKPYAKNMEILAGAADFDLLGYMSNEDFDGHHVLRTLTLGDTAFTAVLEVDKRGVADRLVRPPGRVFVMDSGLFTLFDVMGRNLHGRLFGPRPVALVTLARENHTAEATATPAGLDTLRWGAKRVLASKVELRDSTSAFTMWTSPNGEMLRLENRATDLVVMREPPPVAAPKRRPPHPRPRPH
jgi:hypothetical protein